MDNRLIDAGVSRVDLGALEAKEKSE